MTRRLATALLLALLATFSSGQTTPPGSTHVTFAHASGTLTNGGSETTSVHELTLTDAGSASLRVIFGATVLGPGDFIEVYGVQDGERHELTAAELAKWQGTSAWFNGETVVVRLYLTPGSTGSFEVVAYLKGFGGLPGDDTVCGTDNRIPATDARIARLVTSPLSGGDGTAFLVSPDDCVLTAGHVLAAGHLLVAEFDVPASLSSAAPQHPPVARQFVLDPATTIYTNGGLGNDWGVGRLAPNSLGQSASDLLGFFELAGAPPAPAATLRITGYGVAPSAVASQTLQTDVGPLVAAAGSRLDYGIDTEGGVSGSPVIDTSTGLATGIHTDGGCTAMGGANVGTAVTHPALQAALAGLCSSTFTAPVASFTASATSARATQPVTFTSTATGPAATHAWDFDGDGVVDATTPTATFRYPAAGSFDVTLTVTNLQGSDTLTVSSFVTVAPLSPAALPYRQDFTAGLPAGGEWIFSSSGSGGRIATGSYGDGSPASGSPSLALDATGGAFVTNEAILAVDLSAAGGGVLSFRLKAAGEDDHPDDGVFLSDGTREIPLLALTAAPAVWTGFQIDLTAAAGAGGLGLGADTRITFRQRDDGPLGTDGFLIDDILVVAPPVPDTGQPNTPHARLDVDGAVDRDGLVPGPFQSGPFFLTRSGGDALALNVGGPPGQPFILMAGPLGRANAVFPNVGQLDLGRLGPSSLGDVAILINGASPAGLLDLLGTTGPAGAQALAFLLPPVPLAVAFQVAQFQPTGSPVLLTAATELTIL